MKVPPVAAYPAGADPYAGASADTPPGTPREATRIPMQFQGTPVNPMALPPQADTGCKKPHLSPATKRARREAMQSASLGKDLQINRQLQGDETCQVVEVGRLAGDRTAYRLRNATGERSVAGKEVSFRGMRYIYLEKNLGSDFSPLITHCGVLEMTANRTWRLRDRYAPVFSVSMAGDYLGPHQKAVEHLESLVSSGELNEFFNNGSLAGLNSIIGAWTRNYPRGAPRWERDAQPFFNGEGKLPIADTALELTCRANPWWRGEARLVLSRDGHLLFTPDHYRSFILLTPATPPRVHLNALPLRVDDNRGLVHDPHLLASEIFTLPSDRLRKTFHQQSLILGGEPYHWREINGQDFVWLRSDLGDNRYPGFEREDCRRIGGTGMVVALPRERGAEFAPRIFVDGLVGRNFSEVMQQKEHASPLNYFKL